MTSGIRGPSGTSIAGVDPGRAPGLPKVQVALVAADRESEL